MRKKTTYVFNIILMIVVLIFTFYTLLHGEDLRSILKVLRGADKSWLIFAALFAVAYLVLQAVSLKIIGRNTDEIEGWDPLYVYRIFV